MTLRTLSWLTAATLTVSAGFAAAQMDEASSAPHELPEEVAALVGEACGPIDPARGIAPQHHEIEDDLVSGDLWLVPCNAGAYQTTYEAIYQAEDADPRKLLFAQWRNGSWTGADQLFDPTFDADTAVLSDQYKDRGAGGCGGARTWQWQGADFHLIEYRAAEACDEPVEEYPVIFEAE
ncbi:DUF1176 domain-containing protein [Vreelandella sp. GE22]